MDFNLSEEQQMLRDSAERYIRESYTFEYRNEILDSATACADEQWQTFAELGWLGVSVPEASGGLGFSIIETAVLAEELGRGLVLEPLLSNTVLCAEILNHCDDGSPLLASLVEGGVRLALAHSEPEARYGFDAVLDTVASAGGDGYTLNGAKTLVLDGACADKLLVTATCGDERALFLVPADAPGVKISTYPLMDGTRGADIAFDGVVLPGSARLLSGEAMAEALDSAFDRMVLAESAAALGAMEKVIAITGDYVNERQQFGQPIGKFQALQHRLAEMFVEVQESRSALYRGLAHIDADPEARGRAVSAAKVAIARSGKQVGALGIQLHGGYGMTMEYQVGHYFRYLTAYEKKYGDLDFHLARMFSR